MKFLSRGLFLGTFILLLILVASDLFIFSIPSGLVYLFCFFFVSALLWGIFQQGLIRFFIRRLCSSLFILFSIASITFVILRLLPGGPFDEEKVLPPIVKANIEKKYGLDKPLSQQYGQYILGLAQGHLGYSYKYEGRAVTDIIRTALPISFKLGFYALIVSFCIGLPLGVLAAARHGTSVDKTAMVVAISGISLPSFLVAPILIYIFSFGWPLNHLFPSFHEWLLREGILLPPALWHSPRHYILPVFTLGVRPAAFIARLTRASVLDVISSDFVRTARAKGLQEKRVLFQHVLRNSLIPVLTYAGPLVAGILTGSFIIEVIFAIPGIAKYFVQSVFNRDYPLIMGLTLMFSSLLVLANLLVDVLYKVVDPRIEVDG